MVKTFFIGPPKENANEREKYIIEQRNKGVALRELGDILGITGERVRQLEKKARPWSLRVKVVDKETRFKKCSVCPKMLHTKRPACRGRCTEINKLWSSVEKKGDCWEWQRSKIPTGYGRLNSTVYAHRFSYKIYKGKIPKGFHVLHHCDNPSCVNPEHLYAGTHQDNMRDRDRRGNNIGFEVFRERVKKGEAESPVAKLKTKDVLSIRKLYQKPGMTQMKLAKKFGVSCNAIHYIVNNKTWKHLPHAKKKTNLNTRPRLTEQEVKAIRKRYENSKVTQTKLAVEFNVSAPTISNLINKKTYKQV